LEFWEEENGTASLTDYARYMCAVKYYKARALMLDSRGKELDRALTLLNEAQQLAGESLTWRNRWWINDQETRLWYWLGICQARAGNLVGARGCLERVIEKKPYNSDALGQQPWFVWLKASWNSRLLH
jgi:tetratricopeptide (TPR) repeat protein